MKIASEVLRALWLPISVYGTLALVSLFWALGRADQQPAHVLALVIAGVGLWTLLEYWIHRSLLHNIPRGSVRRYVAGHHMLHHRNPSEHPGIVLLWFSVTVAAVVFGALVAIVGQFAVPVMAGVFLGYLLYEYSHLGSHASAAPITRWGARLRAHHLVHHRLSPRHNFAITMPIWDRLFRTRSARQMEEGPAVPAAVSAPEPG